MFTFLNTLRKPIYLQIENYQRWRAIRYPTKANEQLRLLRDFVHYTKIRNANEITAVMIYALVDRESSVYFKEHYFKTITSFLKYARTIGYVDAEFALIPPTSTIDRMSKVNPLLHVEQVRRVKKLKDERGLSFRQIKLRMESEDKRKYDLKNLHHWYHYPLPE